MPDGPGQAGPHTHYLDLIERAVEGEATIEEIRDLEAHTTRCDACRRMYEAERRLSANLSRLPRMLPPSDLRAQILREAAVERERRMGALDTGQRFAEAINPEEPEGALFEPATRGTVGTRRRQMARYAPIAASIFVVISAVAALLTSGSFGPQATSMAARAVQSGSDLVSSLLVPGRSAQIGGRELARPAERAGNRLDLQQTTRFLRVQIPALAGDAPSGLERRLQGYLTRAETVVRQLADAAGTNYPPPAEEAPPLVAALVLRPESTDANRSFDSGELEKTIAGGAGSARLAGLEASDQFVFNGRRYRCYHVEVSADWLDHMQRALDGYKTPNESAVLRALADQGHELPVAEQVASYQAPAEIFTQAASSFRPVLATNLREIQLYVVDP